MKDSAIVLFSGGQDSTTCLAWALENFREVHTIGFDYGQKHSIELECRDRILSKLKSVFPNWRSQLLSDVVLDLNSLKEVSESALTQDVEIALATTGLPNTFVPGRNIIFFSYAAAVAYRKGIKVLVGGMCETDFSGYPDCRRATIDSLRDTLSLGMDYPLEIVTPLMQLTKAETWSFAEKIGGEKLINLLVSESHTCYLGDRSKKYEWGYGCGKCPACALRQTGWENFKTP